MKIDNKANVRCDLLSEIGPANGLRAWYPIDKALVDKSSNKDGQIYGSPVETVSPSGKGLIFDGASDYGLVPDYDGMSPGSQGCTYSLYVIRKSGFPSNNVILIKDGDWNIGIWVNNTTIRFHLKVGDNIHYIDATFSLPLNVWTHLTWGWTGSSIYAYVNAMPASGTTNYTPNRPYTNDKLTFAANTNGVPSGMVIGLADFRFYDRWLSHDDIKVLHQVAGSSKQNIVKSVNGVIYLSGRLSEVIQ